MLAKFIISFGKIYHLFPKPHFGLTKTMLNINTSVLWTLKCFRIHVYGYFYAINISLFLSLFDISTVKQALPFKGSESNCSPTAPNLFWVELFIAPLKLWYCYTL